MSLLQMIVGGLLTIVGGSAAAAFVTAFFNRPKTKAEAENLIAQSSSTILDHHEKWIQRLETSLEKVSDELETVKTQLNVSNRAVNRLRADNRVLRTMAREMFAYITKLHTMINSLGGTPPPGPTQMDEFVDFLNETDDEDDRVLR